MKPDETTTTRTYLAFVLITLNFFPGLIHAQSTGEGEQDSTSETTGPRRFWQAELPGGSYVVALDRISSVSKHSYVIDGNIMVTEVVIDTSGNSLARFYHLEPVGKNASNAGAQLARRTQDILDKVGQRSGIDVDTVIKQHPTTTHAKTVEYRVSYESELDKLFNSVRSAWINGKGKKFTIKTRP